METPEDKKEELFASFTKTISVLLFAQLFLAVGTDWLSGSELLKSHYTARVVTKIAAVCFMVGFTLSNLFTLLIANLISLSEPGNEFAKLSCNANGIMVLLLVGSYFLAPPTLKLAFTVISLVLVVRWWFAKGSLLLPKKGKRK